MNQHVHFSEDLSKYELLALTLELSNEVDRNRPLASQCRMQKANLVDWETGLYLTTKMLKTAGTLQNK